MVLILAYLASIGPPVMIGRLHADHALQDTLLMLVFGWLAFKRDRWWPLATTATMVLVVMVHLSMVLVPGLDHRADLSARLGLGILTTLTLLFGVFERWLAGERPVSQRAIWHPVGRAG